MKINQKGFGTIEGLLLVIILAIIGGAGWFVYHSTHSINKSVQQPTVAPKTIASFSDCVNAGHKPTSTIPATCIANGKTFTDYSPGDASMQQVNYVKFSSVDTGLQQAITASFTKNDSNCKLGTVADGQTTANKDQIISHYDASKGAFVAVGCGSGTAHLFGKDNGVWKDVESTQLAFSCVSLKKYQIPADWLDTGQCSDGTQLVKYQ